MHSQHEQTSRPRIVVMGGGIGGMTAAMLLARRGWDITLVEQDVAPPSGDAEDDFLSWKRPGTPQGQQGHAFLGRATQVLREELPDVHAAMIARGVLEVPVETDPTIRRMLARRLVYEAVIRRAVDREARIAVVCRRTVTGLRFTHGAGCGPCVSAVVLDGGEELPCDLAVDALGRRSPTSRWLERSGVRSVPTEHEDFGLYYLTRHYLLDEGKAFPSTQLPIAAALDYSTIIVFPADNRSYSVTVTGAIHDPCRHQLRDPRMFDRFVEALPIVQPWINCGRATTEPIPMAWRATRWRRLVDRQGPIVGGFVLLGDAAMHTNPTFSRGAALAFAHAQFLARALETERWDPFAFVRTVDDWTAHHLGAWFQSQVAFDRMQHERQSAALRGEHMPPPTDTTSRYLSAVEILRHEDPRISAAYARAYHLLITPAELLRDRYVLRQVNAFIKKHPPQHILSAGPDRVQFERLISA